jgi:integrase
MRSNGKFQAIVRISGLPHCSRTFPSRPAAEFWALFVERAHAESVSDIQTASGDMELRAALQRYATEVTVHKRSRSSEIRRIAQWQAHPLAEKPLNQITSADLSRHRTIRLSMGIARDTIRIELQLIYHLFEVARTDWGLETLRNPRINMRRMPMSSVRDRRLRTGELAALMEYCNQRENEALHAFILLAVETAMRRSELCSLDRRNIDFTEQLAHLERTKNGAPRTVPLSNKAMEVINALPFHGNGRLFPQHRDTFTKWFCDACKALGIVGLRLPRADSQ